MNQKFNLEIKVDGLTMQEQLQQTFAQFDGQKVSELAQALAMETLGKIEGQLARDLPEQIALKACQEAFPEYIVDKWSIQYKSMYNGKDIILHAQKQQTEQQTEKIEFKIPRYKEGDVYDHNTPAGVFAEYYYRANNLKKFFDKRAIRIMTSQLKESIHQTVINDSTVQREIANALNNVSQDFPNLIHDAMTLFLASQIQHVTNGVETNFSNVVNHQNWLNAIESRIQNQSY